MFMEDQNQILSLPCNLQFKIFAIGTNHFEWSCNLWIQPLKTPNSLLFQTPQTILFQTPKNPWNTLFHTSKFSNPQITLFQTPRKPYFSLQKNPKTPYLWLPKPYFNPPKNPQNTLFQTFKTLIQIPKKTCKHHVSNLENPYFRPTKHHVLDPKIIFQAPKKSYFKAEMKPCFKSKKSLFHTQKFVFQTPKKPCFKVKKILFQTPKNLNQGAITKQE